MATSKKRAPKSTQPTEHAEASAPPAGAADASASASASPFAGKVVVVTGAFVTMERAEAEKRLTAAGATVGSSVTKSTQLLIYGERAGSKLAKAQSLGVALMTEGEMVSKLAAGPGGAAGLAEASAKLAEVAAKVDPRQRAVRDAIDGANAAALAAYGATIPQLLLAWLRVFAARPDVYVTHHKVGRPAQPNALSRALNDAPPEWLAVHEAVGEVHFSWVFRRNKATAGDFIEGYNGGRLALRDPEQLRWCPRQDWQEEHYDFVEDCVFDAFVAEGLTKLSYSKGGSRRTAELIFDDANDCVRRPVGTPLSYLTDGAKRAFSWYWQLGPSNEFTDALFEASLPRETPAPEVEAALVAAGLNEPTARAMRAWLGEAAVLLCYKPLDPEREKRKTLAVHFGGADVATQRSRGYGEVKPLITKPMAADALAGKLAEHESFLATGGGGGHWTLLSASGLPLCVYHGPKSGGGAQLVLRLSNASKRSFVDAKLSYADLSGSCCDGADFTGASLERSVATDASFVKAKFDKADLSFVDFSGSELAGASFRDAKLSYADFEGADLTGADFRGANLEGAKFPGAGLERVKR